MDEKEKLNTPCEEEQPVQEPVEEIAEETAEETAESYEEITQETEEMEQILAEQDSLDADEPTEQAQPSALEIALSAAVEQELITDGQAGEVMEERSALSLALQKARSTIKALGILAGVLGLAVVISVAGMLFFMGKNQTAQPFAGLQVGKSYDQYIKLPDYTKITYTDTYAAPTDDEVQEQINSALKEAGHSTEAEVSDGLKMGDETVLDFNGYVDGEKLDSACATDQELTLGSGTFIPGFEEGLVDHKVGESVTLDLVFPDDYKATELRGKAVKFEVTIKSAKRTTYEELTDALVKEISEEQYATVDAYKNSVYEQLDATKKSEALSAAKNEVWTAVAEGTTLKKYPRNIYDHFVDKLDQQYQSYYSSYGVTDLEGFMQANNLELDTYVKNQIVYEYAIYTIAAKQGIALTDEDFTTMLTNYSCTTMDELSEKLGVEIWELEASLLYDKVSDYLMEVATVKS